MKQIMTMNDDQRLMRMLVGFLFMINQYPLGSMSERLSNSEKTRSAT